MNNNNECTKAKLYEQYFLDMLVYIHNTSESNISKDYLDILSEVIYSYYSKVTSELLEPEPDFYWVTIMDCYQFDYYSHSDIFTEGSTNIQSLLDNPDTTTIGLKIMASYASQLYTLFRDGATYLTLIMLEDMLTSSIQRYSSI